MIEMPCTLCPFAPRNNIMQKPQNNISSRLLTSVLVRFPCFTCNHLCVSSMQFYHLHFCVSTTTVRMQNSSDTYKGPSCCSFIIIPTSLPLPSPYGIYFTLSFFELLYIVKRNGIMKIICLWDF